MKIYLFRHGTTAWNFIFRIQGDSDIALDPLGVKQARIAGEALKNDGVTFDHIFSSPLSRAYRTAYEIRSVLYPANEILPLQDDTKVLQAVPDNSSLNHTIKIPEITVDPRIKELSFGDFEGHTLEELVSADNNNPFKYFKTAPELYNELAPSFYKEKQPESLTHLAERGASFLTDVIEPLYNVLPNGNILITAHGAVNKAMLMHINGETDMAAFWGTGLQKNCSATIIEYDGSSYNIINNSYAPCEEADL